MPRVIQGSLLTPNQRAEVLRTFTGRWTTDCPQGIADRERCAEEFRQKGVTYPPRPLLTVEEWLEQTSFWFLNDGSRLAGNRSYCTTRYPQPYPASDPTPQE